ncbi:protein S100-G-like [Salarias fasciatus]|uniref:Protein S100-G-like n=1 Tax=Salarias fasciatus TaxID=181472 RepID=A0A672GTI6_SALFA|nr:protein S100-G-like [Salarias fasciatus]
MASETELQKVIGGLLTIFRKYAKEDGNAWTLSRAEAKNLLVNELPGLIENPNDSAEVKKVVDNLDENKDNKITFVEFTELVMKLSFYRFFWGSV